jgi:MoxR-like ATPase
MTIARALRPPAEEVFSDQLEQLAKSDTGPRPEGWLLSPQAVKVFICGDDKRKILRKFYGDDALIERAIVGLASNRGLLLVGEPGTEKSMLSELLTAAITGHSTDTIQGSAGVTEDQIKYSWNYALLLADAPSQRALVPSAVYRGMKAGSLVRFEEITRCPPEVQDALIGILSEKLMIVSELGEEDRVVSALPGFNVIATANTRDRGVHEMSISPKRQYQFARDLLSNPAPQSGRCLTCRPARTERATWTQSLKRRKAC